MIAMFISAAAAVSSPPQDPDRLPLALPREERTVQAGSAVYQVDVGQVAVLADRSRAEGGRIELAVARIFGRGEPGAAPIVYLAGGPGEGATDELDDPMWDAYLALGDVLLIDQRGTGRSRPSLAWEAEDFDPAPLFGERPAALATLLKACGEANQELSAQGISLADYTTSASADDVADVLRVLGYERARLLAHSYGTHWALEILRLHPALVERCALLGVAGPDDLLKPAGELEPFVDELARRAASSPEIARALPDLKVALDKALERVRREPLQVAVLDPDTGAQRTLSIGAFGLQRILLADLGDPSDLPAFPRLIAEVARGETCTLSWFASKRFAQARRLPLAFLALRGSSGVSAERRARIDKDARASRFADARNFPFPEILAALGIRDAGAGFREPVASSVPALLVSGTLDANTPVHQAQAVGRTLAKASQLVIENAGHDDLMRDPRIREQIVAFLAGRALEGGGFALEPYRFAPMAGASDMHASLAPCD